MNTKQLVVTGILTISTLALSFTGCRKDKDELDSETGTSIDNAFAEAVFDDAATMADQAALNGELNSFKSSSDEGMLLSSCATITRDTLAIPRVITIDFGTKNCLCNDGRYRRGKIIVTYNGGYRDVGSVHNIGFDNYFVNNYKVNGTKTVTNQGLNASGHTWFSIGVYGSLTSSTGQTMSRLSTRIREWISGESTPTWSDDVYLITGTASGTTFNGNTYVAAITVPLEIALNCRWIKNGVLELTPTGKQTRSVNYGYSNGACDRYAELTIGTHTHIVELR
ncbi:MAG TPA: hypothetical protein PKD91_07855 [Bacteroidia bacterium]|mgnify:CR=1 FL=1|nr:hypothetical protein [Bacteroidia bacterium]